MVKRNTECICTFAQKTVGDGCDFCNPDKALDYAYDTINDLEAERDRLLDVLYHIKQWCVAYPVDIFPELEKQDWTDLKDKIGGNMVSRISASNMRHVVTKIAAIIPEGSED